MESWFDYQVEQPQKALALAPRRKLVIAQSSALKERLGPVCACHVALFKVVRSRLSRFSYGGVDFLQAELSKHSELFKNFVNLVHPFLTTMLQQQMYLLSRPL
jgi:hypothetical protein